MYNVKKRVTCVNLVMNVIVYNKLHNKGKQVKNIPSTGKFVLYHLGQENDDYVLASAVFDVNGPNVKVTCYINEEVLKEINMKRDSARIMWRSLVEDGYTSQNALSN